MSHPLDHAHDAFRYWLGASYDQTALDAVLAAAAVEQLGGDPVWLMLISGAGNAKTETVQSLRGAGATVISTISGEAGLLSGTARKDRSTAATGGLLRKIGPRGILVVKDFTSILSMNRDRRTEVLGALREVYDGYWQRNLGADGGITLDWAGRLVLIAACTTAYDSAHAVIASMGDRFAVCRTDSADGTGRLDAGRRAINNVGQEEQMRKELSDAAAAVLAQVDPDRAVLTDTDMERLLLAADLVTLARTAVERDYRGEVIEAHAPEAPTRFTKMLAQVARGVLAIGGEHDHAIRVAMRVAGDSMPPLRLSLLGDVAEHPASPVSEIRARLQKPRTTVDRALQELHELRLLTQDRDPRGGGDSDDRRWYYSLARAVDTDVLAQLVSRNVQPRDLGIQRESDDHGDSLKGVLDVPGGDGSGNHRGTTGNHPAESASPGVTSPVPKAPRSIYDLFDGKPPVQPVDGPISGHGPNIGPCCTVGCDARITRYGPEARSFCPDCLTRISA